MLDFTHPLMEETNKLIMTEKQKQKTPSIHDVIAYIVPDLFTIQ